MRGPAYPRAARPCLSPSVEPSQKVQVRFEFPLHSLKLLQNASGLLGPVAVVQQFLDQFALASNTCIAFANVAFSHFQLRFGRHAEEKQAAVLGSLQPPPLACATRAAVKSPFDLRGPNGLPGSRPTMRRPSGKRRTASRTGLLAQCSS